MPTDPMPMATKGILWGYALFNLAIAGTVMFAPGDLDATYRGGAMTPTREFLWFSIGSFHLFVIATTLIALRLPRAADRRWLILANAGFYLWDALTQWAYWGAHVGLVPEDLHVNAGVSAVCAAILVFSAWMDRARQVSARA